MSRHGRGPDAHRDGPPADHRGQPLPLGGAEGLGVAHARDPVAVGGHDHGGRDHGATGRRDPDLVDTHDPGRAVTPQRALPAEGRDDHGHRRRCYRDRWQTRRHATPLRRGRRVHDRARPGQPAGGRAGRHRRWNRRQMQRFARWTNLSETTFVLPPEDPGRRLPGADLHARRRAAVRRPPDARHVPCLARGGRPCRATRRHRPGVRRGAGDGAAPRRRRWRSRRRRCSGPGPVDEADVVAIAAAIGLPRSAIVDAQWGDNGPGWVIVLLESADGGPGGAARRRDAGPRDRRAPPAGGGRSRSRCGRCTRRTGSVVEDPVTGSLNASAAGWLLASGRLEAPYTAPRGPRSAGRADRDHAGPRRDGLDRRPERDGGRGDGRPLSATRRAGDARPGHGATPGGGGRRRVGAGRARGEASGARGGWSPPCRRGRAGSTAWRAGPGRGA